MWVIRSSQTWESTANYITRVTNIYQNFWQIVVVCQVGNIHYRNWDPCKSILQSLPVRFLGECAEQSISFLGVRSWHPFSYFKCNLRWKISCRLVFLSGFIHCHKGKMGHKKGLAFTWLLLAYRRVMWFGRDWKDVLKAHWSGRWRKNSAWGRGAMHYFQGETVDHQNFKKGFEHSPSSDVYILCTNLCSLSLS